jgi:thymidylate synthase (FAD)
MKIVPMEVTLIDSMGSDLSVVNAARVSFAKESHLLNVWAEDLQTSTLELSPQDQKLIGYLARHNHWTPFAHAFLSFRIKAPIFVARQLVKHQVGLAWNEESRRYIDEEPEFWLPTTWRGRPVNAKQGSDGVVEQQEYLNGWLAESVSDCLETYSALLRKGVAPEQARMVLPLNTMTEWIWSGSLMAFARVCKLRLDPHAQQETQEIAKLIQELVPTTFQHSWKALLA